MKDALIFDMDGTLWDAVETYAISWNAYFDLHHINLYFTKDELKGLMGLEQSEYLKHLMPQFSTDKRDEIYEEVIKIQYQKIEEIGGSLYPNVIDGLEKLASKYQLFIVSNCPEFTIQYFMKWAKIEHFITDTRAHGQTHRPKYENIKELIDLYQLKKTTYIGDTASDEKQSKIAKIPFVWMTYGFGLATEFDFSFDSFTEFTNYFCLNK